MHSDLSDSWVSKRRGSLSLSGLVVELADDLTSVFVFLANRKHLRARGRRGGYGALRDPVVLFCEDGSGVLVPK